MDDILSYHQHGNLSSSYASIILHRRSVSLLHPLGLGLSCHVASKPPTFSNASLLTHKVAPIPHPCLSMTSSMAEEITFQRTVHNHYLRIFKVPLSLLKVIRIDICIVIQECKIIPLLLPLQLY